MRLLLPSLISCASLALCGNAPPMPSPTPTPEPTVTPSPTPEPIRPLDIVGDRFYEQGTGRMVPFLLAASCCDGSYIAEGWPVFNEAFLLRARAAGATFVTWRLGPMLDRVESSEGPHDGYAEVDGRADLTRWNDAYWQRMRQMVQRANELGLYVEVDLICGWELKPKDFDRPHPWSHNVQGLKLGNCATMERAPHAYARSWVRQAVLMTGDLAVTYQIGNETFSCAISEAWERGVADVVRATLDERGWHHHPIGSNSHIRRLERIAGYGSRHIGKNVEWAVPESEDWPLNVNELGEVGGSGLDPMRWNALRCEAEQTGIGWVAWRGEWTEAEWEEALGLMRDGC